MMVGQQYRNILCECGRKYRVALPPAHCRCGRAAGTEYAPPTPKPNPPPRRRGGPCIHRSDAVGIADCDCKNKPEVYECGLHERPCVKWKPVTGPMLVILAGEPKPKAMHVRDCRTCPDRVDP